MSGSFIDLVTSMAAEAGLTDVSVNEDSVHIDVPRPDTGPVRVTVRPVGEMHGKEVLEFSSAGLALPNEDAHKMPLLILALQRNADILLGHWGLEESSEGSELRVFHSQITETMDLPELRGAVMGVADEYATLHGAFQDLFDP